MTQQYDPVQWHDETPRDKGTLINAARLNQMQTAHHYADGFREVDTIPTEPPTETDYNVAVFCTANNRLYRWNPTTEAWAGMAQSIHWADILDNPITATDVIR